MSENKKNRYKERINVDQKKKGFAILTNVIKNGFYTVLKYLEHLCLET